MSSLPFRQAQAAAILRQVSDFCAVSQNLGSDSNSAETGDDDADGEDEIAQVVSTLNLLRNFGSV